MLGDGSREPLRAEYIFGIFWAIYFTKLLLFSYFSGIWPNLHDLAPFLVYNFVIAWILALPTIFLKEKRATYPYVIDILLTLALLGDSYYIRFFGTLPVMSMIGTTTQIIGDLPDWISKLFYYSDILFVLDIIYIWLRRRHHKSSDFPVVSRVKLGLSTRLAIAILPLVLVALLFTRDLSAKLPYLYNQTSENKVVAKNIGVIGAHLVDFSRNFASYFSSLSATDKDAVVEAVHSQTTKQTGNSYTGIAKNKRIIMIQVESLNNTLLGRKVEGQEITPNLNRLVKESTYFNNHFFTLGAGGTSDADFSVNTSLYPLGDSSIFVKYGKNNYTSLPKALKNSGYVSSAYHANSRGYWNRNTVYKSLGFNNFFAADNYKKGTEVNMGLSDQDFLSQSVNMIEKQPVNSFNYLITLSSHFSFEMPENLKTIKLTNSKYPSLSRNYLEVIHYTDAALGNFLTELKSRGLYDDSLIVIYGDHSAKFEPFISDEGKVEPNSLDGKKVPLIIKLPGQVEGKTISTPNSHLDIMPTILGLVGTKTNYPMYGRDLFGSEKPFFFTFPFENNFEQIVSGNLRYINDGEALHCFQYSAFYEKEVDIDTCNSILSKRNLIEEAANKFVKNNLFNSYLKKYQ